MSSVTTAGSAIAVRRAAGRVNLALAALFFVEMACGLPAVAKTPGTTYCYLGACHRVLTLEETARAVGSVTTVVASHYDVPWRDPFNPSLFTSSGEMFRAEADDSAASPIYPDGTRLLVWEPVTGGAAVVRVNNAGPYFTDRMLDLSRGAADKLGLARRGVGRVDVLVLSAPEPGEATYVAGRVYDPVPGYLGTFSTISDAEKAWRETPHARGQLASSAPGRSEERAAAVVLPLTGRVVVIPGKAAARAGSARGTRVVLLPVKLRRQPVLRVAAAKKAAASRRLASNKR